MEAEKKKPKYRAVNRAQALWTDVQVEELIGADHPARLIWELVGRLDLTAFEADANSFENEPGRSRWKPRLLVSVLAYGHTLGTGSAREIARLMSHEPGLRWLVALETINHHTLRDFRTQQLERLQEILTQVLAVLAEEKLVDFQTLLQDGTKIQAQASWQSFHRRAREVTTQGSGSGRAEAARSLGGKRAEVRVSESEPEAKKMKHADGGFSPSYNLQLVTEGKNGITVGWEVSAASNDQQQLHPGLAVAQSCTQQVVQTMAADAGYATRANVEALASQKITLVSPRLTDEQRQAGSLKKAGIAPEFAAPKFIATEDGTLRCPAGAALCRSGRSNIMGCRSKSMWATRQCTALVRISPSVARNAWREGGAGNRVGGGPST